MFQASLTLIQRYVREKGKNFWLGIDFKRSGELKAIRLSDFL